MDKSKLKNNVIESVKAFEDFLTYHKNEKQDLLAFIQNSPAYICDLIKKFKDYCDKVTASKHQKFAVLTHLTQYYAMYEFLNKSYCNNKNDKDFGCEVMQSVIKQFLNLCNSVEPLFNENYDNTIGCFIYLMDMVLEKTEGIDVSKGIADAKCDLDSSFLYAEEILCFAMSVAQVGSSRDLKIITASCQVVLHNIENLKVEMGKEEINLAMCNLLVETYTNSLCNLEAKVNLVVLNLCLKAFSDYRSHVLKLYDGCLEITNKTALDFIISNFDLYMDRIFQIGLFSLACSSTTKRSAEIKIILTNLQFLEQELVPAFMATTTNSLKYRRTYANVLMKFWCLQVKNLRTAVHNIIEPEAYCQLIYEELNENVERIWSLVSKNEIIQKDMIEPFIHYTKELGKMVKTCLTSFDNDQEQIIKELQIIHNVVQELEVSTNVFLDETLNTTTTKNVNEKIFKRCKILVKSIKTLWTSIKTDKEESTGSFFDDSVTYTKADDHLKTIIAKSHQLVKDRSMCSRSVLSLKLNFTRNLSRMAQPKRHLKFKDSFIDNDAIDNGFGDLQKSFHTVASINEEDF